VALAKNIAVDFRNQVDDTDVDDPAWSDTEVIRYMNLAINDFARKTLCINDAQTVSIVELAVTQDSPWVPYSELILEFDPQTAYSQGQNRNLPMLDKYSFLRGALGDDDYGGITTTQGWQTVTGTPKVLISNFETESLRAYPIPIVDDTLEVVVKRLPINAITDIGVASVEEPEIPAKFHEHLVVFMQYRAYLKQDAECYDKGLSDRYLLEWTQAVIPDARAILKRMNHPKGAVSRYRPHG
jgi:hypothetical protein